MTDCVALLLNLARCYVSTVDLVDTVDRSIFLIFFLGVANPSFPFPHVGIHTRLKMQSVLFFSSVTHSERKQRVRIFSGVTTRTNLQRFGMNTMNQQPIKPNEPWL